MQSGLFTREGRYLVGRIGDLKLKWDRHAGGKLVVAFRVESGSIEVGDFTMGAKVEKSSLCSASDPDPRLIVVEAGPHRLVLRALRPPEVRPLSQPRSGSCVSMPDRSAPRPVEAGHRRPDSSYCIVGYEGVRKRYEATADYVSSMIHSKFFTESNWAKDSFQRLRCWISRTICTASRSMGGTT